MTLQEQIVEAWRIVPHELNNEDRAVANISFAVGVLTGSGFPHSAMFVLGMAQNLLGANHPDLIELRRKLGLPQ